MMHPDFCHLITFLAPRYHVEDLHQVLQAYYWAERAHHDQKRQTGEPYITHPIEVARLLAHMGMDATTVAAGLLHDVLEDSDISRAMLAEHFGEDLAHIVEGVSKLSLLKTHSAQERQAHNFGKMLIAMAQDIRVILIKLVDRLHNMRTLSVMRFEKQQRIAQETLEIYAPIAERMGLHDIRLELEDLAFAANAPEQYATIARQVEKYLGHRKHVLEAAQLEIRRHLEANGIPYVRLSGRRKHLFSIHKKMEQKKLKIDEMMDVYALRLIVPSTTQCYQAMGAIHERFKPNFHRFKDYIAVPKTNGYQSLHTGVIGPDGLPIEIQIRTEEMNAFAENGLAAHWLYKSAQQTGAHTWAHVQEKARSWIQSMLDLKALSSCPTDFIEAVKLDLHTDEVYVFTPKAAIITLPQGATAVDFAYAIHSDIGDACVAARVDGYLASLKNPLKSGQTVEIITLAHARPNLSWLHFVTTGRAKSHVRFWARQQMRLHAMHIGLRLLGSLIPSVYEDESLKKAMLHQLCAWASLSEDDFYMALAQGVIPQWQVEAFLQEKTDLPLSASKDQGALTMLPLVLGTHTLLQRASCCSVIPGDPMVGILDSQGMCFHHEECPSVAEEHQPTLSMELAVSDQVYVAYVHARVHNQPGALARISQTIAQENINITHLNFYAQSHRSYDLMIGVEVLSKAHLDTIIHNMRLQNDVIFVQREWHERSISA